MFTSIKKLELVVIKPFFSMFTISRQTNLKGGESIIVVLGKRGMRPKWGSDYNLTHQILFPYTLENISSKVINTRTQTLFCSLLHDFL